MSSLWQQIVFIWYRLSRGIWTETKRNLSFSVLLTICVVTHTQTIFICSCLPTTYILYWTKKIVSLKIYSLSTFRSAPARFSILCLVIIGKVLDKYSPTPTQKCEPALELYFTVNKISDVALYRYRRLTNSQTSRHARHLFTYNYTGCLCTYVLISVLCELRVR